jgi:hypothetical protein
MLLAQDAGVVTAVVARGITPCIGVDYQLRMDTVTALDFVYSFTPPRVLAVGWDSSPSPASG